MDIEIAAIGKIKDILSNLTAHEATRVIEYTEKIVRERLDEEYLKTQKELAELKKQIV